MKILLSTRERIVGGGEIFLRDLAVEFSNLGHEVIIRSHSDAGVRKLLPEVTKIGIMDFSTIRFVLANDFRSLWMAVLFTPFSRKVLVVHGIWQVSQIRMIFCRIIGAKVLCVSESLTNQARKVSQFGPEISQLLLSPRKPEKENISDPFIFFEHNGSPLRIGNIARLDPVKNLQLFSDLIERLKISGFEVDASLLTYKPENKEQSEILGGLSEEIRIFHDIPAYEYLTHVDILVNTSVYESFGYSLIEALLSGVAVFSTAIEGPSEFLVGELSKGYYPGICDCTSLCSALLKFRESVDKSEYLRSASSVLLQRSPRQMASKVLEFLK
jgi:glycosyltransferase involved in cell wall biosynthesis